MGEPFDRAAAALIQRVCEYDDRTSPEDWPEALLITGDELEAELRQFVSELLNTPEVDDFLAAVPAEASHQVDRWGVEHDAGKSPLDWFWLIGFLAQKAAAAAMAGDLSKAKHHTISTAAALLNWHRALSGAPTALRPGIATPLGEAPNV